MVGMVGMERGLPLLDFLKAGEERDGDEDDDCFLAVADFELWVGERERGFVSFVSCHFRIDARPIFFT